MSKRSHGRSEQPEEKRKQRKTSIYDVVAGRVGLNGFLTPEQQSSNNAKPLAPEEVLLKDAGTTGASEYLQRVEQRLQGLDIDLPDSDLLKAIHAYAADFYDRATLDRGKGDFGSLDGSALIAIGCLLEEEARQMLGENGDMVLVEPRGLENGLPESMLSRHQVTGKVKPPRTPEQGSEASSPEAEDQPRKKRRG
jgi:hypothetical protein